tara:strand:+ start:542 stop:958 length:417 start_codon:yes stop_codon:yes gene_type:complete
MTIEEKINYYRESLEFFDDNMEKYKFLLDQGKKVKPFPEEYRNDSFKVEGCQSQVWLVPQIKDNILSFYCDSDAFLPKGMITILCDIFGNRTPAEISKANFELLLTLKLDTLLTPGRRNGVFSMLKKIKEYAISYNKN